MLDNIFNPDLYHGYNKNKNFFEGWYFKIVDAKYESVFAFIPGIHKSKDIIQNEAFVQILDGHNKKSYYINYGIANFKVEKNAFNVTVGKNTFCLNEIRLNHYDQELQILGTLKFSNIVRWPDSKLNPGSMGFYNYLTFMECFSQVCALDGNIDGKLLINNKEIDFTGGKVYIEKNWGKSFPKAYIWLQSNHFNVPGVSFTCSIGKIPMRLFSFNGFLVAFVHEDKVYKFTTINKSKMKKDIQGNHIKLSFSNKQVRLNVDYICQESDFISCKGPNLGEMTVMVKESITSKVKVELFDLNREKTIFTGEGNCSGVELMGDIDTL